VIGPVAAPPGVRARSTLGTVSASLSFLTSFVVGRSQDRQGAVVSAMVARRRRAAIVRATIDLLIGSVCGCGEGVVDGRAARLPARARRTDRTGVPACTRRCRAGRHDGAGGS